VPRPRNICTAADPSSTRLSGSWNGPHRRLPRHGEESRRRYDLWVDGREVAWLTPPPLASTDFSHLPPNEGPVRAASADIWLTKGSEQVGSRLPDPHGGTHRGGAWAGGDSPVPGLVLPSPLGAAVSELPPPGRRDRSRAREEIVAVPADDCGLAARLSEFAARLTAPTGGAARTAQQHAQPQHADGHNHDPVEKQRAGRAGHVVAEHRESAGQRMSAARVAEYHRRDQRSLRPPTGSAQE